MKSIKFDYIISNPPYALGNTITKSVIDNVDFDNFINLMPASKYKGNDLYKNVVKVESVEDFFDDAAVGASLTISMLSKGKDAGPYTTYDDFENEKRDPKYREFYKLNAKCNEKYIYLHIPKNIEELRPEIDFMVVTRSADNGAHTKESCPDIIFNIQLKKDKIPWHKTEQHCNCNFLRFENKKIKDNFNLFWYKNKLQTELLNGLNKAGGKVTIAIPNIDYSIDRDYEHLTLDDIMKILKEENPNAN